MLQAERREAEPTGKGKKPAGESVRIEKERLESYSNLLFEMISKLGFLLPEAKYEDDPLRRSYQPSLSYRGMRMSWSDVVLELFVQDVCWTFKSLFPKSTTRTWTCLTVCGVGLESGSL